MCRSAPGLVRAAAFLFLLGAGSSCRSQMLDRLWARFLPRCQSYSLAADGSVVVSSDWDGTVQAYSHDGKVLWRVKFPSQVDCVAANGGALYVAYMPQETASPLVYLLDSAGQTLRTERAPGPVRTASVSEDGRTVAILSEPARVTILRRSARGWRWQRRLLLGTVTSLAIDATGTLIAVAHRSPSGIVLLDNRLRVVWRYAGDPSSSYRLRITPDGRTLAALTIPAPGGISRILYWRTDRGVPAWSRTLAGDLARFHLAPDGRFVAASYRTRLWHRQRSVIESRVTLFTQAGRRSWEVGGLIFGAQLIGATAAPLLVLTHDGARVLAALDGDGHMRARHRLLAPVRSCVISTDATHFAVFSDARVLYLFSARH